VEIAVEAIVKLIPLSADTIARRIQDMSDDIDQQHVEHFADNLEPISKLWALQINKSTDIRKKTMIFKPDFYTKSVI
jgi:hypothetical protein